MRFLYFLSSLLLIPSVFAAGFFGFAFDDRPLECPGGYQTSLGAHIVWLQDAQLANPFQDFQFDFVLFFPVLLDTIRYSLSKTTLGINSFTDKSGPETCFETVEAPGEDLVEYHLLFRKARAIARIGNANELDVPDGKQNALDALMFTANQLGKLPNTVDGILMSRIILLYTDHDYKETGDEYPEGYVHHYCCKGDSVFEFLRTATASDIQTCNSPSYASFWALYDVLKATNTGVIILIPEDRPDLQERYTLLTYTGNVEIVEIPWGSSLQPYEVSKPMAEKVRTTAERLTCEYQESRCRSNTCDAKSSDCSTTSPRDDLSMRELSGKDYYCKCKVGYTPQIGDDGYWSDECKDVHFDCPGGAQASVGANIVWLQDAQATNYSGVWNANFQMAFRNTFQTVLNSFYKTRLGINIFNDKSGPAPCFDIVNVPEEMSNWPTQNWYNKGVRIFTELGFTNTVEVPDGKQNALEALIFTAYELGKLPDRVDGAKMARIIILYTDHDYELVETDVNGRPENYGTASYDNYCCSFDAVFNFLNNASRSDIMGCNSPSYPSFSAVHHVLTETDTGVVILIPEGRPDLQERYKLLTHTGNVEIVEVPPYSFNSQNLADRLVSAMNKIAESIISKDYIRNCTFKYHE